MLNIALPKGRLGDKTYSLFEKIGYKMTKISSGKNFDIYTIAKLQ